LDFLECVEQPFCLSQVRSSMGQLTEQFPLLNNAGFGFLYTLPNFRQAL